MLDDLQQDDLEKLDVLDTSESDVNRDDNDLQFWNVNDETHIKSGTSKDRQGPNDEEL